MMRWGVLIWCLLAGPATARDAVPNAVDDAGQGAALPVLFDGAVRFRWQLPGDDAASVPVSGQALAADGRVTGIRLVIPAGAVLEVSAQAAFVPEPLPGFGAVYGDVRPVAVDGDGQHALESGEHDVDGQWFGIRNRYRAVLLSELSGARVVVDTQRENEPRIRLVPEAGAVHLSFRLYAGPVEQGVLRAADPVLTRMLFAALWDWLRWLCFGMLWLLTLIDGVVGNIGWSIVLLSVAVKILMTPLTRAADRLQASVNATTARLQPEIAAIKREFKGEDAHNRVLAAYKKHGVHPLYTMKSLAGFLLQIPVFIAAFDMLGENYALNGASFLWMADLARPDQWLALPVTLPFFGGHLNLLPCLMTLFTLLTSALQQEAALTPELIRQQRVRLFWMAGAFFLLFYTFPAGMVLYWTTNNVLALGKLTGARLVNLIRGR